MSSSKPQAKKPKGNKNKQTMSLMPNNHFDRISDKSADIIRRFVQQVNAVSANINVSSGASKTQNATASITLCGAVNTNVTTDPCFAMFFTLADLPQSSTWTALFDRYRITNIEVSFTPNYSQVALLSSTQTLTCTPMHLYYVIDKDDAGVVSPLSALMEYENCKRVDLGLTGTHVVSFKPHTAVATYASGAFTSYGNLANEWIDCASSSVQHYGIKFGLPCLLNTSIGLPQISVNVRYTVEFKTVR
jgi:hypothetical protein